MIESHKIKEFYDQVQFPGYYTQSALGYHSPVVKNSYLCVIERALKHGSSVLDVGCGTGLISNLFAQKFPGKSITGIDFADSIDYARKFAEDNDILNVQFIKEDFLQYQSDKTYDVVICQGVLHHMPDRDRALKKLKTLLSPGGTLVVGLYHPWGKFLKKWFKIKYGSEILYKDQELNAYETSFCQDEVFDMFKEFDPVDQYPGGKGLSLKISALKNSRNGGLVTYSFRDFKTE